MTGIAIDSNAVLLQPRKLSAAEVERLQPRFFPNTTPDESRRQEAAVTQATTKAHTVFREGEKVVGVVWENGTTTMLGNQQGTASAAIRNAWESPQMQGLTDEERNAYLAQVMGESLKASSPQVQATQYAKADAPMQAELWPEMFQQPIGHYFDMLNLDSAHFAALKEALQTA